MANKSLSYDITTRTPWVEAAEKFGESRLIDFAGAYRTRKDWQDYGVPARSMEKLMRLFGAAPILHAAPQNVSSAGGGRPERGGAEMRVARLCTAVNAIIRNEIPAAEAAILNMAQLALPRFFDDWDASALVEIEQTITILKQCKSILKRKSSKRPA